MTKFDHTLQWFSDTYGLKYQTVARAAGRGYPLDDPAALLKKYDEQPGGNQPDLTVLRAIVAGDTKTLEKLGRAIKKNLVSKPPRAKTPPPPPADLDLESDEPISEAAIMSMSLAGGLMDELARLKRETHQSHQLYIAEQEPANKRLRNKIWLANLAALRQLAKEAPKAERDANNVLVVADVEAAWSRSFKEFKTSVEALARRVSTLPVFAKCDPVDVEEAINKEVVTILSHLESGSWLKEKDAS